jgi:DNA-binding transcriptional regulator LsrR (DeoR family)
MATRGTPLSVFIVRQIQELYAQGWGRPRIARHLGISDRTVRKYRPQREERRAA